MNKIKNLIFFSLFILLVDCSFGDKTGIWTGSEEEKAKAKAVIAYQKLVLEPPLTFYSWLALHRLELIAPKAAASEERG